MNHKANDCKIEFLWYNKTEVKERNNVKHLF